MKFLNYYLIDLKIKTEAKWFLFLFFGLFSWGTYFLSSYFCFIFFTPIFFILENDKIDDRLFILFFHFFYSI